MLMVISAIIVYRYCGATELEMTNTTGTVANAQWILEKTQWCIYTTIVGPMMRDRLS